LKKYIYLEYKKLPKDIQNIIKQDIDEAFTIRVETFKRILSREENNMGPIYPAE